MTRFGYTMYAVRHCNVAVVMAIRYMVVLHCTVIVIAGAAVLFCRPSICCLHHHHRRRRRRTESLTYNTQGHRSNGNKTIHFFLHIFVVVGLVSLFALHYCYYMVICLYARYAH